MSVTAAQWPSRRRSRRGRAVVVFVIGGLVGGLLSKGGGGRRRRKTRGIWRRGRRARGRRSRGVRDEVEAVVCIVVAKDLERRGHGCGARLWQAEGENLHRDAAGREWLVHRWSELCVVMEV